MDTMTSGIASILCEDCFSPLIQEEISIFQGLNPEAHVTPIYTDEVTAMNLFMKDSIRLVVAARDLTTEEFKYLKSKKLVPRSRRIAVDGIALIINKRNKDSIIGIPTFKKILNGEITDWGDIYPQSSLGSIRVVFDNPNSSTVRYVEDSICGGKPISGNVKALKSNREVIDFVSNTSNAIGIIGVGWISNKKDTTNLSFIEDIRVMSVSPYEDARVDNSYKPFAAYLALKKYPMVRDIYMITSDVAGGLPAGVLHFVAGDRGQRIVLKCGLVPANRPMRLVSVKSEF
ncbi:MAG: substrate-binding domain-containing protein [Bacteroidales bacterium]|nr:substrate-binding domain-containing protein [Bacteroidales bacterium]